MEEKNSNKHHPSKPEINPKKPPELKPEELNELNNFSLDSEAQPNNQVQNPSQQSLSANQNQEHNKSS